MKPPFLFFSVHPPFWCQRFVLNVNNLARSNNKSMLTLTLAPFVPIMLLPSAEDLCIFDIKFLLSSRLLSCWLFLTRRPRSPNFPIFNAGHAHPPPPDSFRSAATKFCGTSFVGMCCLHCSWTSVCCPVPILYFEAHWTMFPSNNVLLFTNWVAPVHSGSDLADGCLDIVGWGGGGYYQVPRGLQTVRIWPQLVFQSDSDTSVIQRWRAVTEVHTFAISDVRVA